MKIKINHNYFIYFGLMFLGASGFLFAIFLPMPHGLYAFVAAAGLAGAGVSAYIWHTKKGGNELVCPAGSNCNVVVNSNYSKFLGIKLEHMGVAYYSLIFLSYAGLSLFLDLFNPWLVLILLILTAGAFLFSCYLMFVQAFLLRQWCIWCLLASMMSMIIFIVSLVSLEYMFSLNIFAESTSFISALHSLGFILGLGASTTAAFLFYRFLKDFEIDESEMAALKSVSEISWLGLWIILISQFAFVTADPEIALVLPEFLLQTIALIVAGVSGAFLLVIFAPFLSMVPFKKQKGDAKTTSVLASLRRPIFVNGAIALASWYFAFFMDYIPFGYNLTFLVSVYIIFLILAVLVSLSWNRRVKSGKVAQGTQK